MLTASGIGNNNNKHLAQRRGRRRWKNRATSLAFSDRLSLNHECEPPRSPVEFPAVLLAALRVRALGTLGSKIAKNPSKLLVHFSG